MSNVENIWLTEKQLFIISKLVKEGTNLITKISDDGVTKIYINGDLIATFGRDWMYVNTVLSKEDVEKIYDIEAK